MKPYKTWQFWLTAVLTLGGLTLASGAINPIESRVDEVIGWLVTMGAALGVKGWGPQDDKPAE